MIYIRRIFKQDLRNGKQVAFPTESSNIFFNFDFKDPNQNSDRAIFFEFKEINEDGVEKISEIKTRLYAAKNESRIDGELKRYLIDKVGVKENDIILFKKTKSPSRYTFEVVKQSNIAYKFYNELLGKSNHEVIIEDVFHNDQKINLLAYFAKWLNEKSENNYFESDYDKTIKGLTTIASEYEKSFDYDVFEVPSEEEIEKFKKDILDNIVKEETSFFEFSNMSSSHRPRAILGKNNYIPFLNEYFNDRLQKIQSIVPQVELNLELFIANLNNANLSFSSQLITRFIASLVTKPFVLLNGLSGSGKTKLAQAFVQWICQEDSQYRIIPVGADWTNRDPLLGYPDGLNNERYVTPDNGALQLILDATNNPELPYFMILDEMNLSHVERYFADFLSVMESEDTIKLYTGNIRKDSEGRVISTTIKWPSNLFIIGTVNIDETTYMFSPKVLDRANVIEFRLEEEDLEKYFANTKPIALKEMIGKGVNMAHSFLSLAHSQSKNEDEIVQIELLKFFKELSKIGAEFGYRTANEVLELIDQLSVLDHTLSDDTKIDIAVMQKLLPKLHGSRSKIVKVLNTLTALCLIDVLDFEISTSEIKETNVKYPITYAKLMRMYHNAIANGFTSYAEA